MPDVSFQSSIRKAVKRYVPMAAQSHEAVVRWYASSLRALERYRRQRRPAQDVFAEVYEKGIWGGGPGSFYSGGGSDPQFSEPYCAYLQQFVKDGGYETVTVVDLGCGDFRVGRQLLSDLPIREYVGVVA
jgi:hypothetical protein